MADIDWSGIRAAAVALDNVRAAARQAAADLPEPERTTLIERINKRALREGWLDKAAAVQAVHSAEKQLSMPVQNGHQIIENTLAEDSRETRLSLSKAARNMAKQAETAKIEQAGEALQVGKLAALTHGWEQAGGSSVSINLLIQ